MNPSSSPMFASTTMVSRTHSHGMKVIIEAGVQLSLKAAGGFIDIGPAGVSIQGTMVLINSGGAAASAALPGDKDATTPSEPDKPAVPKDPLTPAA